MALNGRDLESIDEAAGIISTKITPMRVNVSGCDCEIIKWKKKDTRPLIDVSVVVGVKNDWMAVRAHIIGNYPKDQISGKIIEEDLLKQFSWYLE